MRKAVPCGTHSCMATEVSFETLDQISMFVEGTHPLLYSSVTAAPLPYISTADFCEAVVHHRNKPEIGEDADQLNVQDPH